ncbi:MAG: YdcF family protein [Limisphaerales bacterium]
MASFVHPLGLLWLLLVATSAMLALRRRGLAAALGLAFAGLVWLGGQPPVAAWVIAPLERPYAAATIAAAPPADAVVVLGGSHRVSPADFQGLDLTCCADRLVTGVELARRGRARLLVLGGDGAPRPGQPPESARLRDWWRDWGLTNFTVETLGPVGNTRDEAVATATLARERGWTNVLMVTSALHLRRAEAAFRAAQVPVTPVACDFQVWRGPGGTPLPQRWTLVPQGEAWATLAAGLHERVGWWVYRGRGWL